MKKAVIWTLVLLLVAPMAHAGNLGWPDELSDVQKIVKAKFGDIPFHRIKIRQDGKATEVSIRLKHIPRQFREVGRQKAGDDDIFLATSFVELFEPDFDVFGFDVFPIADFVTYYYGFVAFNFGKKLKRRAEITVVGGDGVEIENIKKKLKLNKNSATFRWVEDTVSAPGLYFLYTEIGPYSQENFFCSSCG